MAAADADGGGRVSPLQGAPSRGDVGVDDVNLWRMWVLGEARLGKCRLMNLLERFEHFGCGDDRDRIYASLGWPKMATTTTPLSPSAWTTPSRPSSCTQNLPRILSRPDTCRGPSSRSAPVGAPNTGLPSWVPDWRVPPLTKTFWQEPTEVPKWEASVEQVASSLHAVTASLYCLLTWETKQSFATTFHHSKWNGRTA